MIDSLVANWINYLPSVTQLISTNIAEFTHRSWLAFISTIARLVRQIGWINLRTWSTNQISMPLFCPNCYPFRNADGDISLMVCVVPGLYKIS